jgi:hypothetical protein
VTVLALLPDFGELIANKPRNGARCSGQPSSRTEPKRLFNQYAVILVNPAKHPHVKTDLGQAFIDWLISREGKNAIAGYKIEGQQAFVPNFSMSRADVRS